MASMTELAEEADSELVGEEVRELITQEDAADAESRRELCTQEI
ncbi:hypothetical protein PR003_g1534 [Phytophthora rubi]|uniref:Uncharacterized protein n=2 Tax=Phytophthora TaxID=4783 RepID=A0A6A4G8Y5_9STRA|nr:hypothetical protein PR002_g13703 [Phytophthora rubi]KAE9051594.1 hypothetical protein PR001_g1301 [Phytophthora rubi]KAE9245586.1 hypothetical protein PF004_g5177 [Phytophthora fragariae]KAE9357951.1 hypothetical protein PR003_g1534 [Phytophthora rubi]